MSIKEQIKKCRNEKNWTQSELAGKTDLMQKQISAYERGSNIPSTDALIKIANALDVSLDYLVQKKMSPKNSISIKDRDLLQKFEALDQFSEEERSIAKTIIDLVISKHKFKELALA